MDALWSWRDVEIFGDLSSAEIDQITQLMPVRSYRRGELLYHSRDPATSLFILRLGTVKVFDLTPKGEVSVFNVFKPGDIFGELFLGRQRARLGHAQALEDVVVGQLDEKDFIRLTHHFPRLAFNFIRHFADEHRNAMLRIKTLTQPSARHRVLGTLLTILTRQGRLQDNGPWVALPQTLTQEDIANLAGLSRATASAWINRLRDEGIAGGTGREITINIPAFRDALTATGLEPFI